MSALLFSDVLVQGDFAYQWLRLSSKPRCRHLSQWPLWAVGSTDRRNILCKSFGWRLIKQGLSWTLVELPGDYTAFGLAVYGQVGATWEILA